MKITTLSSAPGIPFNNALEEFSKKFQLSEDVECYQLYFCPYGDGTSFDDLNQLKFQSKIVILNVIDSIIDREDNIDIEGLKNFCAKNPENNFILLCPHLNLQRVLDVPNLYIDEILPTTFTAPFKRCEKKEISNRFLSLNADTKLHRVMTISYLLSKEYGNNGDFTFDFDRPLLKQPWQYKNLKPIPEHLKKSFAAGHEKLKAKELNLIDMPPFDWDSIDPSKNHNEILVNTYETYGVEIITGSMFFERSPLLSEKELQNIYGKNFPIYINGVGMAREMKKMFDLDLFEDVIDHSYDEIEDHFERMAAAIDRNRHLLDGSTNIQELWTKHQHRFESNCDKIDSMFYNTQYQNNYNFNRLKLAFAHFNVTMRLV